MEKGRERMSKIKATVLIVLGEVVIYLLLLVALPAYQRALYCDNNTLSMVAIYGPLVVSITYLVPLFIGITMLVLIWKVIPNNKSRMKEERENG